MGETHDALNNISISYLSDMNDLAMTCGDYKNALNM